MDQTAISTHSIRPAAEDDVPFLLALDQKFFPQPWTEAQWREEFTKPYSRIFVLTDDETDTELAGYIVFWVMGDECQIQNVAVDLAFRGLGFGARLVREAVRAGMRAGVKRVVLEVRFTNKGAIGLYQSIGFTILSVRKRFYSDGEDAYQMVLELDGERVPF